MSIMDLLFNNIFYVVIIVGFIFSMLHKMKGKTEDAEHQPAGMPAFDGRSSLNGRNNNNHRPKQYPVYGQRSKFEQQSTSPVFRTEPPVDSMIEQFENHETAADRRGPTANDENFHENAKSKIKSNQVVQGVIWSEILSPPRAKRPFRR